MKITTQQLEDCAKSIREDLKSQTEITFISDRISGADDLMVDIGDMWRADSANESSIEVIGVHHFAFGFVLACHLLRTAIQIETEDLSDVGL